MEKNLVILFFRLWSFMFCRWTDAISFYDSAAEHATVDEMTTVIVNRATCLVCFDCVRGIFHFCPHAT
jgi:hypothetical protein